MNKSLLKTLILLAAVGSIYGAKRFYEKRTDGFSIARIRSHLPYNPIWEQPIPSSLALDSILNQKFHYLGSGGQCFVFSSEDQQFVIKFFKQHTIGHLLWIRKLPLSSSFKQNHFKKISRCEGKLFRDFNSYKIAFEDLKEESGLLFLHLTKTDWLKKKITLVDKLGIAHVAHLDDYEFILQKKAEPFKSHLKKLIANDNILEAAAVLKNVLTLVRLRYQKGILDEDPRLYNNIGFLDGKALFIDAGRFKKDPKKADPQFYLAEMPLFTSRLKNWLELKYPVLVPYFDNLLKEIQND
jgi:hypothetical protein